MHSKMFELILKQAPLRMRPLIGRNTHIDGKELRKSGFAVSKDLLRFIDSSILTFWLLTLWLLTN